MFFDELSALVKKEARKKYDVCIHAAAVSDYKMKTHKRTKLSSKLKNLKLDLVPTTKIINQIKRLNPNIFLVGFKFEPNITKTTAKQKTNGLFTKSRCDLVIANSLRGRKYSGYILNRDKVILGHNNSRKKMSQALVNIVKDAQ